MSINWIGGILSMVVLGLILLTGLIIQNSVRLLITGNRAVGVVVGTDTSSRIPDTTEKAPLKALMVEFSVPTGDRIKVSGRSWSASLSVPVGEVVTVAYDPSNPRNAQLLLWSEFPLGPAGFILGFVVIIILMWIAGIVMSGDSKMDDPFRLLPKVISHFHGSPKNLKKHGVQAVATVIEANQEAHTLHYRIDKETTLPAAKSHDFISLEITLPDWKPSQTFAEIRKGDQFRVYLDPLKPDKNYYIDFNDKLGNDPFVQSLDEEDDSDGIEEEELVGKLKDLIAVCSPYISIESIDEIEAFIINDEPDLAFQKLLNEIMNLPKPLPKPLQNLDWNDCSELGTRLGLDEKPEDDPEFWEKFKTFRAKC